MAWKKPMNTPASVPQADVSKMKQAGLTATRFVFGCCLLAGILLLPDRPWNLSAGSIGAIPVELPATVGLLLLCRGRLFRAVLISVCTLAALLLFMKLADLGTFSALGRPFNPLLDLVIIKDGWLLLSRTIGRAETIAVVAAAIAAWIAAILAMAYCLAGAERIATPTRNVAGGVVTAILMIACVLAFAMPQRSSRMGLFDAGASNYFVDRIALMRRSAVDLATFNTELKHDPLEDLSGKALFGTLKGRNVYVLFVESYGRTVLSNPAFRSRIAPRLAGIEAAIGRAGYSAVSGWMKSPTVGGQSWLAHGALLAGVPTTDQSRYERMIASSRKSLNMLFREAGWRTVAVMPAITMEWPEGRYFGYDEIHASNGLGYKGLPFNWVTMPDQYTLTAAHRIVAASPTPVMVEAALISSHAPWTPVAELVPWEAVGDGSIFDRQALSGEAPSAVWAEPARVRDHYVRSVDYALATIGEFIAHFGDNAVFVVLGDHQPAQLVTGDNATRDVPFHVIANDPAILKRLQAMDLSQGMIPKDGARVTPMWEFREGFVRAMSPPG